MKAAQAREMAKANIPKLVEANFLVAKTHINRHIVETSKKGEFSVAVSIILPVTVQNEVIKNLETHFSGLGYRVNVTDNFASKMMQFSWEQ